MPKNIFNFEHSYHDLGDAFYVCHQPDACSNPQLIYFNHDLAQDLNIDVNNWTEHDLAQFFSGTTLTSDCKPLAMAYAGHQFGHFVPQLGDGRALLLGEHLTQQNSRIDIQLKGSGKTHFSRGGDGLAPLGAMIRELLISECLSHLGIPSTRSLAVVSTGAEVQRDTVHAGAVLTRTASSHLRVGSFEYFYARQDLTSLKRLLDYALKRHDADLPSNQEGYLAFFDRICRRQVSLMAHWMSVGFIHGVMNTDNCSISGESIDFGPCAFMDEFAFDQVFSSIDQQGRYAYDQQASILFWNLACLARCLLPFIHDDKKNAINLVEQVLARHETLYQKMFRDLFAKKLGIFSSKEEDDSLIMKLLTHLENTKTDFTLFFYGLANNIHQENGMYPHLKKRLTQQKETLSQAISCMKKHNPLNIARNHWVEKTIQDAYQADFTSLKELLKRLKSPYEEFSDKRFNPLPSESEKVRHTFCGT